MASLNKLSGKLGKRLAAHLLRRATYRITPKKIDEFAQLEASEAVELLFKKAPLVFPDGPLSWNNNKPLFDLKNTAKGEHRLDKSIKDARSAARHIALWRLLEASLDEGVEWKIVNWFASIFTVKANNNGSLIFHYWFLLMHQSFKDLKSLAFKVTLDNQMLAYLNNQDNTAEGVNENYAREFLELFTILKGPTIAPGNYTNYTESDITRAAEILSGYRRTTRMVDEETGIIRGRALFNKHVKGDKVFSSAFQGRTIKGAKNPEDMDRELSDFIDMVFNQDETARAYVRRMYLFFVSDYVSEEVEANIINPLAAKLKENGYKHIPILKQLLESEHFYDRDDDNASNEIIGKKVKSPMELLLQSVNILELENRHMDDYEKLFHKNFGGINVHMGLIGMDLLGPETVEGYAGYNKSPGYSRNWFTSNYLHRRYSIFNTLIKGKSLNKKKSEFPYHLDVIKWAKDNIELPGAPGTREAPVGVSNAQYLVDTMIGYLLPEKPEGDRYDYFLNALLGDLSATNWYFAWSNYISGEMDDSDVRIGLEKLTQALMSSPEFQTF